MKSVISVVVPCYNNSKTLKVTLDSVKNQSFRNFELIVVDDCSTDNSFDIARKYTKKVFRNKKNLGPAATRNFGIKKASAPIIALTDSDCSVARDWLEKIAKRFGDSDIDVVMGRVTIPKSTFLGDSISALGFPAGGSLGFENVWHVSKEGWTDHISTCNAIVRKCIFRRFGFFDESFPVAGAEDSEFSYRIIKKGVKIKYCPEIVVEHEPRVSFGSFVKWQIVRGESNYHFKRKVGNVGSFVKLRLWYTLNIIKTYWKDIKFPLIMVLLLLSFVLQQVGYLKAKWGKQ